MHEFEIQTVPLDSDGNLIENDRTYCIMLDNAYFSVFYGYLDSHINRHLGSYAKSGPSGVQAFIRNFNHELANNTCPGCENLSATMRMMCGHSGYSQIPFPSWVNKKVIINHIKNKCEQIQNFFLEQVYQRLPSNEFLEFKKFIRIKGGVFISW